jgi:dolichol-phosphate mannosyltransferase
MMTVVLPTFNEEEAIGPLIDQLKQNGYSNILVVDGRSTDRTIAIAQEKGAQVVVQHGLGKRDALEKAFQSVKTEYLLVMDADMTYDPRDIKSLLEQADNFDEIVGARDLSGPNMSALHRLGNRILTFTFNIFFGTKMRDICSGMYLIRTRLGRELEFIGNRLAVEEVILAQATMSGRVTDVNVSYGHRIGRKPTTQTWRQGLVDLGTILTLARRYNPIMLFSVSSASALVPAVILLTYAAIENYVFRNFRSGIALLGAMLLLFASQGLAVTTLSYQMRRIERMLRELNK